MGYFIDDVDRQADRFGLVGERTLNRLLYPPGSISGEFRALGWIKAFDSFDQPNVTLVDQVEQRKAQALIVTGNFYHQAQVSLDHVLTRLFITLFDSASQCDLFFWR